MDANLKRCMDLSADLLRAAYNINEPIERDLAIGVAECVAYLIDRINQQEAGGK